MPDTIPVRFRDCACPGTPHPDGDIAELRPFLDYAGGAEALRVIRELINTSPDGTLTTVQERMGEYIGPVYIRRGVVAWNVLDDEGEPVPVTPEALDALSWDDAYELGDRADDLYGGQVLAPLVRRRSTSSKAGPTVVSTPPRQKSSRKRRKPSGSSS